jgi:hypothetical protein
MNDSSLPISDGPYSPPPVYDCRAILTLPTGADHTYYAVVGNLSEVTGSGATERDCLRDLVTKFKNRLQEFREAGEEIPWTEPPISPNPGQQQRWIPVHL